MDPLFPRLLALDLPFFKVGSAFSKMIESRYTIFQQCVYFSQDSWIWIYHFSKVDLVFLRWLNLDPSFYNSVSTFSEKVESGSTISQFWISFHKRVWSRSAIYQWWIWIPQESWIHVIISQWWICSSQACWIWIPHFNSGSTFFQIQIQHLSKLNLLFKRRLNPGLTISQWWICFSQEVWIWIHLSSMVVLLSYFSMLDQLFSRKLYLDHFLIEKTFLPLHYLYRALQKRYCKL